MNQCGIMSSRNSRSTDKREFFKTHAAHRQQNSLRRLRGLLNLMILLGKMKDIFKNNY